MNATQFLTELWGSNPPGLIALWRLDDKRSHYLKSAYPATAMAAGQPDMFTGVALAHKNWGPNRRVTAKTAAAIAGLWLDLDINGGPTAKTGAAPTTQAASELSRHLAEPTLVVHSGYGLHAWWLFDRPWRFRSAGEQAHAALMSAQWHHLHRAVAQRDGWSIDAAHDLARLLRLPGTINTKGPQGAGVTIWAHRARRYTRPELDLLCAAAGAITAPVAGGVDQGQLEFTVTNDTTVDPAKLDALIYNSDEFAATWNHSRPDATGWSMSEYDLSIARLAAMAGWADQELADLIRAHRHRFDPADAKALRVDYLRRTIHTARGGDQAKAIDVLKSFARRAA